MLTKEWEALLEARLGRPVRVSFGRSRTAPLQVEQRHDAVRIRMHEFFGRAPDDVRESLARWIRVGRRARRACRLLDDWIDARLAELPARPARRVPLETCGEFHDLAPLADGLFAAEFAADFETLPRPRVTWGHRRRSRARRTLFLGSYQRENNVVRVHPALDRPFVPDWFVRYVLHHEILHAALPGEKHGPTFRLRERAYPDFRRATAWEKANISRLIRVARRGSPAPRARQRFLF